VIIGIIGILMIVLAWRLSKKRTKNERTIDDKIMNFKTELSRIEKEG
jgi:uncharacterized membrane-anchored protein YhcB (DUF1043 family)